VLVMAGQLTIGVRSAYRTVMLRTFEVEATDGHLDIDFNPIEGEAVVSTLQVQRLP
jgi:hypothetical protein